MEYKQLSDLPSLIGFEGLDITYLALKFRSFILEGAESPIRAIAAFITQLYVLEVLASSPKTLMGLEKVERLRNREISLHLSHPEFYSNHIPTINSLCRILSDFNPQPLEQYLTSVSHHFNLQICQYIPHTRSVSTYYPPPQSSRHHKLHLLTYNHSVAVLISHKLEVMLKEAYHLDPQYILTRITVLDRHVDIQQVTERKENCERIVSELARYCQDLLAVILSVVKRIREWIANEQLFTMCKDSSLAEAIRDMFQSLVRIRDNPELIPREALSGYIELSLELTTNVIPYHFLLECMRCRQGKYVKFGMLHCGHSLCEGCFMTKMQQKEVWVDASGKSVENFLCSCKQVQNVEVIKQDKHRFNHEIEKANQRSHFCSVCKEAKLKEYFSPPCCDKWTCVNCIKLSTACQFCSTPFSQPGLALAATLTICVNCHHSVPFSTTYGHLCPNQHTLCSPCQVQSLSVGCCIACQKPYDCDQVAALKNRFLRICKECGVVKPWQLLYLQGDFGACQKCYHPRLDSNYQEMKGRACIHCGLMVQETGTQRAAWTLHCGCLLHTNCQEAYFTSCDRSKFIFSCYCSAEIDHSLIFRYPQFREYIRVRGLEFPVSCPCGGTDIASQAFETAAPWTCSRCRQLWCVLCDAQWDEGHKRYGICEYAGAARAIQELAANGALKNGQKRVVQCPACFVPFLASSEESSHTCENCKTVFCATCSVAMNLIQGHSVAYHRPQCRHYKQSEGFGPEQRCARCRASPSPCEKPTDLIIPGQFTPVEFKRQQTFNR